MHLNILSKLYILHKIVGFRKGAAEREPAPFSPHFTLIEGRVIKPFPHRHASMSWAQAFDTVTKVAIAQRGEMCYNRGRK